MTAHRTLGASPSRKSRGQASQIEAQCPLHSERAAERAAALARDATQTRRNPSRRLTEDDIRPGELCGACEAMWGYGLCPRGDLNPHALLGH
jgi:hypothetical protein